jgi:hypothetical protein
MNHEPVIADGTTDGHGDTSGCFQNSRCVALIAVVRTRREILYEQ